MLEYNYENDYVNSATGFMFRYINSESERFVRHWHDYYEIFLVLEGDIIHEVNGTSQHLTEGALAFIRPGDIHRYICEKNCRFLNLTFSKETMNDLVDYLGGSFEQNSMFHSAMPPSRVVSRTEKIRIFRKFQQINTLEISDREKFRFHMRAYLAELISVHFFEPLFTSKGENGIPEWLEALCAEMTVKENFVKGTERMLELSGKSREHLARSIKKYYGVTLSEFINGIKLNYAANMLITSNLNVLDICFDCGFENSGYFHRRFKSRYGCSPLNFRVKNKNFNNI